MNYIQTLQDKIQHIDANLTLDASTYNEILAELDLIKGDVMVMHTMGELTWKCRDLIDQIKNITEWINDEIEAANEEDDDYLF